MTAHTMLKGGVLIADEALRLAWALEDRGIAVRRDGDRLVLSGPGLGTLTDADRTEVARWKPSLLAIVDYEATPI